MVAYFIMLFDHVCLHFSENSTVGVYSPADQCNNPNINLSYIVRRLCSFILCVINIGSIIDFIK